MNKKHLQSPLNGEYTLCGDAFDAYETKDAETPIEFAKDGETVTCQQCRHMVYEVRKMRIGRLP